MRSRYLNIPLPSKEIELFSREWLNILEPQSEWILEPYKKKVINIKTKLNNLNKRLDNHKNNYFGSSVQRAQETIGRLKQNVGIWHISKCDPFEPPYWLVRNELTKAAELHFDWDQSLWGKEEKDNHVILILLSSDVINWLNDASKWCNDQDSFVPRGLL